MIYIKMFENYALDKILDKISKSGKQSLTKFELQYLDNFSSDVKDEELENIVTVEEGHVINGRIGEHEITFTFLGVSERDEYLQDDILAHEGNVEVGGHVFQGVIVCDEDGEFDYANFVQLDEKEEGIWDEGVDLYETFHEFENELNDFFTDVCGKLSNHI
jgi:hypothetical protein